MFEKEIEKLKKEAQIREQRWGKEKEEIKEYIILQNYKIQKQRKNTNKENLEGENKEKKERQEIRVKLDKVKKRWNSRKERKKGKI